LEERGRVTALSYSTYRLYRILDTYSQISGHDVGHVVLDSTVSNDRWDNVIRKDATFLARIRSIFERPVIHLLERLSYFIIIALFK
jgi:hypothetical protein